MDLTLRNSRGRRLFKKLVGQNNHFLITILVGLNAVEEGTASLSEEFRTSWSPKDEQASARRSRDFAIKATLIWICDSIDAYLRTALEEPCLFSPELRDAIEDGRRQGKTGISDRLQIVAKATGAHGSIPYHLTQMGIVWRNRVTHYKPKNRISPEDRNALANSTEAIRLEYQGLDIMRMMSHASKDIPEAPNFKEITSLIRASQQLIQQIDDLLIGRLNMDLYLEQIITEYVRAEHIADPRERNIMISRRIQNIWGKQDNVLSPSQPFSRRVSALYEVGKNYGMSPAVDAENKTSPEALQEISALSPEAAMIRYVTG